MVDIELSNEAGEKETLVFRNEQTIIWNKMAEEPERREPIQVELVSAFKHILSLHNIGVHVYS